MPYSFSNVFGSMTYHGIPCPLKKGQQLNVPIDFYVSTLAPGSGPGSHTVGRMQTWDKPNQQGNCIFCVEIDFYIEKDENDEN